MHKKSLVTSVMLFVVMLSMNIVYATDVSEIGNNGDTNANNQLNQPYDNLPSHAKRYYNSEGQLIGAIVEDPEMVTECEQISQSDSMSLLDDVIIERNGSDVIASIIDKQGVLVEIKTIKFQDILEYYESAEEANIIIKKLPEYQPKIESKPIPIPEYEQIVTWILRHSDVTTHQWTNIAELYSGPMMNVHLQLKMTSGTYSVTKATGTGFTYGSEDSYAKTWVTDLYAYNWQTFTVRMMMDYVHQYWECVPLGFPWIVIGSKHIWKCDGIRGGTIELTYPYPDMDRSKTTSDDSVSLNPGQSKSLVYSDISTKSFEFNVGIKLKKPWVGPIGTTNEFEVPLISISHISGHYTSSETVYTLTSTANYYHIWDIYEFGSNIGTSAGFIPAFSLYS